MENLPNFQPKRLVVFRALMLGDMLCAVPAFRALRCALPDTEIVLVGLPWARAFAERFHRYFDDFVEFPGYPGLPEREVDVAAVPAFLAAMQRRQFDGVLQMHGSGSFVNALIMLFGARRMAGFYTEGDYCPDSETFLAYPDDIPEIHRHLRLMTFLGIPMQGDDLEFPLTAADRYEADNIDAMAGLAPKSYVCIHPGARFASRRWTIEGFSGIGDMLAAAGFRVVLTGSASEKRLTGAVSRAMIAPSIDLAGCTSLGGLGQVVERSRLVVTNDTGMSHVAAALKTPSVVVVLGSNPSRWAPLNRRRHRIAMTPIGCRPCNDPECSNALCCAVSLRADMVADVVRQVLKET